MRGTEPTCEPTCRGSGRDGGCCSCADLPELGSPHTQGIPITRGLFTKGFSYKGVPIPKGPPYPRGPHTQNIHIPKKSPYPSGPHAQGVSCSWGSCTKRSPCQEVPVPKGSPHHGISISKGPYAQGEGMKALWSRSDHRQEGSIRQTALDKAKCKNTMGFFHRRRCCLRCTSPERQIRLL